MTVKRRKMPAVLLMSAALMFGVMSGSACGSGSSGFGGQEMIGPRSKEAWARWEEQQKSLRETWDGTEIYAYVQTIMADMQKVNRSAVLKEDFSLKTESSERDALLKLHEDMNLKISPEEFLRQLNDSSFVFALGGKLELESIEERKEGDDSAYDVVLLYYPNPDSLMTADLPVVKDEDGKFTAREVLREEDR